MRKIWKEDRGKVQEEYEGRNYRRELEWISFAAESHAKGPFLEGPNRSQNPPKRSSKKLKESSADLPAVLSGGAVALRRVGRGKSAGIVPPSPPPECVLRGSPGSAANGTGKQGVVCWKRLVWQITQAGGAGTGAGMA